MINASVKAVKFISLISAITIIFLMVLTPITITTAYAQESLDDSAFSDNEFDDFDEFEEFNEEKDESNNINCTSNPNTCGGCGIGVKEREQAYLQKALNWTLGILAVTFLTGFLVRYRPLRNSRGLFLIGSIAILGFYKGACPCPISSFSNLILVGMGVDIPWQHLIWFLGLIPITYLVGKVWCGWICHLGALQEILFIPGRLNIFTSDRSQKIMKALRWVLLAVLIIQLIITKTYLFNKIDPFKVAFNLLSINITGWILLGLLILTSLFIYRPFCRAVCPIGLVLGWVSKIPGASIIGVKGECRNCKVCSNACKVDAIHRYEKHSVLDNKECIACGDCLDACTKKGLAFVRKGNTHKSVVSYENTDTC